MAHVDAGQDPPIGTLQDLFTTFGTVGSDIDLYDRGRFAVGADGQRFLFTRAARGSQAPQQRMILVENWRTEFQKPGPR